MRFSGVDSRSSFMGPENIDRKPFEKEVDQNSRNSLIVFRALAMGSDWLTTSWPTISSMCQPLATRGQMSSENIFPMAKSRSTRNTQPSILKLLTNTAANKKLYKPDVAEISSFWYIKPSTKACVSMSMARALPILSPTGPIQVAIIQCKACKMREREIISMTTITLLCPACVKFTFTHRIYLLGAWVFL